MDGWLSLTVPWMMGLYLTRLKFIAIRERGCFIFTSHNYLLKFQIDFITTKVLFLVKKFVLSFDWIFQLNFVFIKLLLPHVKWKPQRNSPTGRVFPIEPHHRHISASFSLSLLFFSIVDTKTTSRSKSSPLSDSKDALTHSHPERQRYAEPLKSTPEISAFFYHAQHFCQQSSDGEGQNVTPLFEISLDNLHHTAPLHTKPSGILYDR